MPLRLEDIKAPIAREMQEFEPKFRASMKTRVLLLDKIMSYIVKRKGKQMRPMFVFLSAGTCGGITDSTFRGASLIELLTVVGNDFQDNLVRGRLAGGVEVHCRSSYWWVYSVRLFDQ